MVTFSNQRCYIQQSLKTHSYVTLLRKGLATPAGHLVPETSFQCPPPPMLVLVGAC